MRGRFQDGRLDNARGKVLPLEIRREATAIWNQRHKLPPPAPGKGFDCGDHWWCDALEVHTCVLRFFMCAGEKIGWDNMRSIALRCGGATIFAGIGGTLAGSPVAGIAAAGVGGDACIYDTVGSYYGWWTLGRGKGDDGG